MAPTNQIESTKPGYKNSRLKHARHFIIFSCHVYMLFFLASCEPNFQPLDTNDRYVFSIYGVLDAAADTNWIRISPIREQVDLLTDGSGITVTLENDETGEEIIMNDSLFLEDRNFLNFWTDQPIEYDQTYRLTASLSNGEESEVTIVVPPEMPLPKIALITSPGSPPLYYALIDENVSLVDIQTKYYVRLISTSFNVERTFSFAYRNKADFSQEFPGYYSVRLFPDDELNEIERQVLLPPDGEIEIVYRQVYFATSGIEWDEEIESLNDVVYSLPQTLQNVNNGLGYVLGIDSKYIPYEGCTDEEGNIISCGEEEPFW